MADNLLALINQEGSLGLGEACLYALIGFLIVFIGIMLIIFIIWLIGLILRKTNNLEFLSIAGEKIYRVFKKKKPAVSAPVVTAYNSEVNEELTDEVKAAIIAAIMAYYSEEKPECEFRVRRIKRI